MILIPWSSSSRKSAHNWDDVTSQGESSPVNLASPTTGLVGDSAEMSPSPSEISTVSLVSLESIPASSSPLIGDPDVTWIKLGQEFWDECAEAGLSNGAVRTHGEAIGWVYRIEQTDLLIRKDVVRRFAGSPHWDRDITELLNVGFWLDDGECYALVHHADVIRASIAAQQIKRDRDKRAQQAHRSRVKVRDVSADVSAGVSGDADSQSAKKG